MMRGSITRRVPKFPCARGSVISEMPSTVTVAFEDGPLAFLAAVEEGVMESARLRDLVLEGDAGASMVRTGGSWGSLSS